MLFPYRCYPCEVDRDIDARPFRPPSAPRCPGCGEPMDRVFGCQIDTSGCRDHDEIPEKHRIACGSGDRNLTAGQAEAIERRAQRQVDETRKQIADGGNRGSMKMTHSIPAALYHGKIKETGDRAYWQDAKNRNRHKSCRVDKG